MNEVFSFLEKTINQLGNFINESAFQISAVETTNVLIRKWEDSIAFPYKPKFKIDSRMESDIFID